jgi:hypothetical protein
MMVPGLETFVAAVSWRRARESGASREPARCADLAPGRKADIPQPQLHGFGGSRDDFPPTPRGSIRVVSGASGA